MVKGKGDNVAEADDNYNEGSVGRRFSRAIKDFSVRKNFGSLSSLQLDIVPKGFYITADTKPYKLWWNFMIVMATFSAMFTPFEFGFFTGLPRTLWILDLCWQGPFIIDIILRFFTAHKDPNTFRLVVDHRKIAMRYLKRTFIIELLCCLPWDTIYKGTGHHEAVRCLVWIRVFRILRVFEFFSKVEKNININYFATRIVRLLAVEIFITHTAACFFYYLATTVKARSSGYTWLGALTLGNFSYADFRSIDIGKRYCTSLYWAVIAITTVGYGDAHPVNIREMIFVMIFISFNMLVGAYLLGNITALLVKASHTQLFRDKMASLISYMNKHNLPHDIRRQMKSHVLLQYETGALTEDEIVEDLPSTVRSKVANTIYRHIVQQVPIFRGCSSEFLDEVVSRVAEEHYLPGEVVIRQADDSSGFYIVCHGVLEEILVHENGKVEVIQQHQANSIFGEVGVLCNIPQPFTVRVTELCRLLRLNKQSFTDLVQIYFNDGRLVINNLLEWKDTDARIGQIASDVTFLVAKHMAELTLMVNNATCQGDLVQLKHLVKQGAMVGRADYDGRTALHLAASRGFEAVVLYLIREGADVNACDKFGISPLQEAVKAGRDRCITVLVEQDAHLQLKNSGSFLCKTVDKGNTDLLRRLLVAGVDPSSSDYDRRTALHVAAAEGNAPLAKMLIDAGADIYAEDRWGRRPIEDAKLRNHTRLISILEEAAEKGQPARTSHSKLSAGSEKEAGGGSPKKGPSTSIRSERRSDSSVSMGLGPSSRRDSDTGLPDYRHLPVRPKGRPPLPGQVPSAATQNRKRVTLFPFHPAKAGDERTPGRVDWVPSSIQEILEIAKQHFGKVATKVLSHDGGEIPSTDLIMENEKLYVVHDDDVSTGPSKSET